MPGSMIHLIVANYCAVPCTTSGELKEFVHRNNIWHNENFNEASSFFTPQLIEKFTTTVAEDYLDWRNCHA